MDDNEMNEVADFDNEEEDRYKKLVRILAERHSSVQRHALFLQIIRKNVQF